MRHKNAVRILSKIRKFAIEDCLVKLTITLLMDGTSLELFLRRNISNLDDRIPIELIGEILKDDQKLLKLHFMNRTTDESPKIS